MIRIESLSKAYASGARKALDDVSLHVPAGCIFGLLGPNGAGKTTLLSILVGLVGKDRGTVRVNGMDLEREQSAIKSLIGFVPQTLAFYPMLTVRENLRFFAGANGIAARDVPQRMELAVSVTGLEQHLGVAGEALSGGLQRRLNLAIGLLNRPKLLCLDEPTVGIDPQSRSFILDSIVRLNREGITVVYTSHYMDEVERICERIAIIDRGRILVVGSLAELLGQRVERGRLAVAFDADLPAPFAERLTAGRDADFPTRRELVLRTDEPLAALESLLPLLKAGASAAGPRVAALHYGHRNLEELFLALTERTLRDDA